LNKEHVEMSLITEQDLKSEISKLYTEQNEMAKHNELLTKENSTMEK
jgi:hypothetical protein